MSSLSRKYPNIFGTTYSFMVTDFPDIIIQPSYDIFFVRGTKQFSPLLCHYPLTSGSRYHLLYFTHSFIYLFFLSLARLLAQVNLCSPPSPSYKQITKSLFGRFSIFGKQRWSKLHSTWMATRGKLASPLMLNNISLQVCDPLPLYLPISSVCH
ncbi:uncharacterized protein [Oryza sativa Japonica Group]|jgi:hypothetical protein|uniref:uncharacterized protein n=1 Tax=Oryza sativa subsp. japonica TaxID=39947 RepID=UPI000775489B|nr:uncharacterized protein LOC9269275 [Oryza sativa Japonica Group]XP_015648268.1 uncharacterized protein LOC9269275 [Oryza sativa Japonica Group]